MSSDKLKPGADPLSDPSTDLVRMVMSVHHPVVEVILELDQVVRGVTEYKRLVSFDFALESDTDLVEHFDASEDA
jgi:hypothetical protein